jgi:hypothetical protein
VHEFAHAMSSAFNGAIVDEYADIILVENDEDNEAATIPMFYINRMERKQYMHGENGRFVAIPTFFTQFDKADFLSDLNHPSARENWHGYFPERIRPDIPCTMDKSEGMHEFDKLLHAFMYKRLAEKINRCL